LQAPYFSEITRSIDFLLRLKRDLTLKYESPIYRTGSWKAWRPESLEAEKISFHQAFQLSGLFFHEK
jgi:hypothetical protein